MQALNVMIGISIVIQKAVISNLYREQVYLTALGYKLYIFQFTRNSREQVKAEK